MGKKKENDETLAGIKRIRRSQILSSFDVVFMVLVPIATVIAGYIATHPEVLGSDPTFVFYMVFFGLLVPLSVGMFGILRDSIELRLTGWSLFFIFGITSCISYLFFWLYHSSVETVPWHASQFYLLFTVGSFLSIGFGIGYPLFLKFNRLFLSRMREVGITETKLKFKSRIPNIVCYIMFIIGCILISIGLLLISQP